MALERATVIGVDQIIKVYESFGKNTTFSVWYGPRQKFFQPVTDDYDANLDFLENSLSAMQITGDSTLYYLRMHPATVVGEMINDKTPYVADFPVRVNPLPTGAKELGIVTGMPYGLRETIDGLNEKVKEYEKRIDELENEAPARPDGFMGQIAGLLDNEQVQQVLVTQLGGLLQGIIAKIVPAQPMRAVTGLNGIPPGPNQNAAPGALPMGGDIDLQKLDATLVELSSVMDLNTDLPKLAAYAKKNPAMFNMMLQQLRAE